MNLYRRRSLSGRGGAYSQISEEIMSPREDKLYAWMETRYPQFESWKYASWNMARTWKSLAEANTKKRSQVNKRCAPFLNEPIIYPYQNAPQLPQDKTTAINHLRKELYGLEGGGLARAGDCTFYFLF